MAFLKSISHPKAPRLPLLATLALSTMLAGCASDLRQFTGSIGSMSPRSASGSSMDSLARRYDAKPGEKRVSLDYAAALRANGQIPQAVAVLQRASIANVGDREVAAAYGKVLADSGRFEEALGVLGQAHTEDRPDWQVLSTMGSISDQMGQHTRAREFYTRALQIAPQQPSVLNNLGLSYLLTKDVARAEAVLVQAAAQPGADPRIAANLALAQSLRAQGEKGAGTAQRAAAPVGVTPSTPRKTHKTAGSTAGPALRM